MKGKGLETKMLRVLHVVGTMDLGGIETFLMNLYRSIDRTEIQFDFLCHNRIESAFSEEIKSLGGNMFSVPGMSHCGFLKYEDNLYHFFKEHKEYSIVHSHMNDLNGIILKQAHRAGIKNRYSHIHTFFRNQKVINRIRIGLFKIPLNVYATRAFACSTAAGKQLYNRELQKTLYVVNNGIDSNRFRFDEKTREKIRHEFQIAEEPVIGHVGRFAEVKNHLFLLDCFKAFSNLYKDAKLLLIGTGELEETIRKKCEKMDLNHNVFFLGSRNDVNEIMKAMDVFVFPSLTEGLPVSLIEAQASGLKILTSDTISEESVLTDLVDRFSLQVSSGKWAQRMSEMYLEGKKIDRSIYPEWIKQKGYDIRKVAHDLGNIYFNDANK